MARFVSMPWVLGLLLLFNVPGFATRGGTLHGNDALARSRQRRNPAVLLRKARSPMTIASAARTEVQTAWYSLAGRLWMSLARNASNATDPFEEADAITKDFFITECMQTFNTSQFAMPDEVVRNMCTKAGGSTEHCGVMVRELWSAYNSSSLGPWCNDVFDWFANKTVPRCAEKCRALLCKERCAVDDRLLDLQDKRKLIEIELDRISQHMAELNKSLEELQRSKPDVANDTECAPMTKKVTEFEELFGKLKEVLAEEADKVRNAQAARDTASSALRAAREAERPTAASSNETASVLPIGEAEAAANETAAALEEALEKKTSINNRVLAVEGAMAKAKVVRDAKCKRFQELLADWQRRDARLRGEAGRRIERQQQLDEQLKSVDTDIAALKRYLPAAS